MKHSKKNNLSELRDFLILWSTQSISQLGSSITTFALTLWLYEKTGSSLSTAALTICSYAPYVLMSIFAGALTDRFDKKKTMLACDVFAVLCTITVFVLFNTNHLRAWHLYLLNAISGLMNMVQQPASEVAMTLVIPAKHYQRTSVLTLAKEGFGFLKENPMIMTLILFLSGVNLIASAFDATLPGYVLPNPKGGSAVLGIVTSCAGIAMLIGSLIVSVLPKPKDRVTVIYLTMLFSLGTENFFLAFSKEPILWCIGQILGWIFVPVMMLLLGVVGSLMCLVVGRKLKKYKYIET